MGNISSHTISAVLAIALLGGCALYPAVQVAGSVWTGYDTVVLADEYLPRYSVEGGQRTYAQDKIMERRLRERLRMNNIPVSAHIIDGNAYLIGSLKDRAHADYAIDTASSVSGVRAITCKFYPPNSPNQAGNDLRLQTELNIRLEKIEHLQCLDLRVEVIQSDAILIGKADTYAQQAEAVAVATEVVGINDVVDYIHVAAPPDQPTTTDTLAVNE
ncbi:BON domain-containing protein [Pseudodesulfovibrio sediminis]|uniref:BON domain-containing protein n=1 Tax=Pseudodesulfovibrio sediminis TaxID=2810563 RepID=A0ABN6EY39_9BACT|nr:BON domain-containing protein [Pseudodesulfovibrio sediminis]BCS90125.1 hypothetical protein PSDVSF_33670 [Pseudodesulfovibrio sediminis]